MASTLGVDEVAAEACRCRRRKAHQEMTQTKEEMPKTNRGKEKISEKSALAVVPLPLAVVSPGTAAGTAARGSARF